MLLPATADTFPHSWTVQRLAAPPLILPSRHFVYPRPVPGEDDALARGALLLNVKPSQGSAFLATCALGFTDPSLPTGFFACPRPQHLLAVAGGYAYLVDTLAPEQVQHLALRPAVQIAAVAAGTDEPRGLLLLAGFHTVLALDHDGVRWESQRLSWEGLTLSHIEAGQLHGAGWNMMSNQDVPFALDLRTGEHEGGGFGR